MSTQRNWTGFTLVELLVVIAIIILLISILVPAMERAMYTAMIAKCGAEFRVQGYAIFDYAQDNRSQYPSHPIPRGMGLNVWGIGMGTYPALWPYGMGWESWFCPVAPLGKGWAATGRDGGFDVTDAALATRDNATINENMRKFDSICLTQTMWWIPHPASNGFTPHDGLVRDGDQNVWNTDEWPTRITSQGSNRHPILSDLLYTHPGEGSIYVKSNLRGVHRAGGKTPESANALYGDLSVQLRKYEDFKLVQDAHYGNWY